MVGCLPSSLRDEKETMGAGPGTGVPGVVHNQREGKICRFLGSLSYPLCMTHYVLVCFYVAWISNHSGITPSQAWPKVLLAFTRARPMVILGGCKLLS